MRSLRALFRYRFSRSFRAALRDQGIRQADMRIDLSKAFSQAPLHYLARLQNQCAVFNAHQQPIAGVKPKLSSQRRRHHQAPRCSAWWCIAGARTGPLWHGFQRHSPL